MQVVMYSILSRILVENNDTLGGQLALYSYSFSVVFNDLNENPGIYLFIYFQKRW